METGKIRDRHLVLLMMLALIFASCTNQVTTNNTDNPNNNQTTNQEEGIILAQPQDVSLRTSDDVILKATYYDNNKSSKGLILLHQFSKDRSSWKPWLTEWQKTHKVIAIDLRGHGESGLEYAQFTDKDFNNMVKDAEAAADFLGRKEVKAEQISIMGASIGANTAQNYASTHLVDKVVLLSPGLTFKGINLTMKDNAALVIVSTEDTYSFQSVQQLQKISPLSTFIFLENKGHGTNMLDKDLAQQIAKYLNK